MVSFLNTDDRLGPLAADGLFGQLVPELGDPQVARIDWLGLVAALLGLEAR